MKTDLYHFIKRIGLSFLGFSVVFLAQSAWAYTPEDCIQCHRAGSSKSSLRIDVQEFKASVHGDKATCQECHTGVVDEKHTRDRSLGAVDCGQCHEQTNRHGMGSGRADRPRCYSCHTRHNMLPKDNAASSINPGRLRTTCGGCHPAQSGKTDYLTWLPSLQVSSHKKQDFAHDYDRGNCVGCHQGRAAHGEEGQVDKQQCYKCHFSLKDARSPLMGYIHPVADSARQPAIFASAVIYQLFVVSLLVGGVRFYIRRFSRRNSNAGRR
ncbi:MAG: hypothetical protein ABFD97_17370 [Syntrophobacter sp.]